ncbi:MULTISPECIES: hypothetical protein [unclassified Methylobacterium]|uniref:hypothetical protein n=1 Tax=unclassified Methylobacterium TaxID=2615210 RepID=UPI00226AAEA2|nr:MULTISPECIES: hypothetical protein [unclassified Methylobacterium]
MDRASAVEADPVSSPLVDTLRSAEWLQEIALKDRVAYPLEEGAALLEDHVREGPLAISSVRPGSAASKVSLEEVLRHGAGQHQVGDQSRDLAVVIQSVRALDPRSRSYTLFNRDLSAALGRL